MKKSKLLLLCLAFACLTACAKEIPAESEQTTPQITTVTEAVTTVATEATTEETTVTTMAVERVSDIPDVAFSAESGFYAEPFEVSLSGEGAIYYTTDGSDPATSATAELYSVPLAVSSKDNAKNVVSAVDPTLFSGSFNSPTSDRKNFDCDISAPPDNAVDKCTVIRAVSKNADGAFGGEASATYFIGAADEHIDGLSESCEAAGTSLAVISISMNYDDLFDGATGIYVKGDAFDKSLADYLKANRGVYDSEIARTLDANYKQKGKEWERRASLLMLEVSPDGTQTALSQDCGIRIQGNYSRSDLLKSFRLFARSEYGEKSFNYAVFGEDYLNDGGEVMDKYNTLVLRSGGNCAFNAKFNDAYWQSLVGEMACETKQSRPCIVYLNGEYWGLYVLEEDYSNDFFEDVHGVSKKDVVVYKGDAETYSLGYKLDVGKIPDGESERYYFQPLLEFFDTHRDAASDEALAELSELVDVQSVMDYFAVQCWINNKWDWPGKNWSMWRTTSTDAANPYADGKWRFMFYDMEFGGISGEQDAWTNTIKEDNYKTFGLLDMNTGNPAVLCFAYLMTNDGFREDFCERLSGLSTGSFEKTSALLALQRFEDTYSPLYDDFFWRYPDVGYTDAALSGGYASVQCIRSFIILREGNIARMISYCERVLG